MGQGREVRTSGHDFCNDFSPNSGLRPHNPLKEVLLLQALSDCSRPFVDIQMNEETNGSNKETGPQRRKNFPEITQLISSKAGISDLRTSFSICHTQCLLDPGVERARKSRELQGELDRSQPSWDLQKREEQPLLIEVCSLLLQASSHELGSTLLMRLNIYF